MIYYMYETKNLLNGMIYVGVHSTKNLDDGYFGSGKRLLNAIKFYGKENFKTTIIEYFSSEDEMYQKEKLVVNKEFLLREDTYNIRLGGRGGFKNVISQDELNKKLSKIMKEKYKSGYKTWNSGMKMDDKFKSAVKEGRKRNGVDQSGENNPMYGKPCYYKMSDDEKDEWTKKISMGNTGKIRSEEAKSRYSEAAKKRIWIVDVQTGKAYHANSKDDPRLISGQCILGKKLRKK
ncbi:Seg-like homing endonuclease [Aeromonas phage ZPAH1]|nr:Seg-like homing endonuclease [Aeromonas phage ZPAH1]